MLKTGGEDLEQSFRLLIRNRSFQAEFEGMLLFEYANASPVVEGIVNDYKEYASRGDTESDTKARQILSLVAPYYPRWKTMGLRRICRTNYRPLRPWQCQGSAGLHRDWVEREVLRG